MNILFLRGFNNYFNRTVKKYSTLADYKSHSQSYLDLASINFNPNDGVVTELIIGSVDQKENNAPLAWDTIGTPDYAICYEIEGNPAAAVIKFRWFVLESERTRTGQYRIALKRDVVAEHFDIIKNSPCFIEKGMINSISNPLLFNSESMTYNQIKSGETPLKDNTGSGWIVGYVAKNEPASNTTVTVRTTIESDEEYVDSEDLGFPISAGTNVFYEVGDNNIYLGIPRLNAAYDNHYTEQMELFNVLDYYRLTSGSYRCWEVGSNMNNSSDLISRRNGSPTTFDVSSANTTSAMSSSDTLLPPLYSGNDCSLNQSGRFVTVSRYPTYMGGRITQFGATAEEIVAEVDSFRSTWQSDLSAFVTYDNTNYNDYLVIDDYIEQYDGKKIKIGNQLYTVSITSVVDNFRIVYGALPVSITPAYGIIRSAGTANANIKNLGNTVAQIVANLLDDTSDGKLYSYDSPADVVNSTVLIRIVTKYVVNLSLYQTEQLSTTVKATGNRAQTYDSPADLFLVPYGEVSFKTQSDGTTYTSSAERGIAIARGIANSFGNSCYDMQILPYCPSSIIHDNIDSNNGYIDLSALQSMMYSTVSSTVDGVVSFVLYPSSCTGTFDIVESMSPPNYGYSSPLNYKISNETELYRLASPNYNGLFEYSLVKNNGIVKFNVDYTYKPYMPYIHVNPDFKFLYGQDWDDSRGLVCGGDFSLSFINDAWTNYKLNNKNYQQIFDRQILNMDRNNSIAMEKQEFQATVGTITSAVGGALGGAVTGATVGSAAGPWGALIGGAVGAIGGGVGSGIASAYGAEKDKDWLIRQQMESRSYAVDMYGYQLGNIQAMPYSIKGSDVLINNYKIWPIIERYTATAEERLALVEKIKYNGMTIMTVGKIKDYCTSSDFDLVFVKGQLIRLESDSIKDDFHIADAIYQEINKGVYIPSGGL